MSNTSGPPQDPNLGTANTLAIGVTIANYRLVRQLGEGGMGVVFEAQHTRLSRRAAIKVLRSGLSQDPEMVRRFFTEAESVNVVEHPGIVNIFEFGQLPDQTVYIIMEFLAGESLKDRLKRAPGGRLGLDALPLVRQIASALVAAHAHSIVHRDLKPENVMVVADPDVPGGERTKVLDFGIAKMAAQTQAGMDVFSTQAGRIMGTPAYMSPEQLNDTGSVNDRADVYSLGVMLYEAVSGQLPFSAPSFAALAVMHFSTPPRPLRELDPALPEPLEALVGRMLAKDPAQRPAMAEVGRALDRLMAPAPTVVMQQGGRGPFTTKAMALGGGLALLAIAGAVAVGTTLRRGQPPVPKAQDLGPTVVAAPAPPPVDLPALRDQSLGVLEEGLRDPDPVMRRRAAAVLGTCRDARYAPLGEPLLGDPDPAVQAQAAETLGQLGARQSVPLLLERVRQGGQSEELRVRLEGALSQLGEPEGLKLLRKALRSQGAGAEQARYWAALYLATSGDAKARDLVLRSEVPDEEQVEVLGRLARFGDKEALAALQSGLPAGEPVLETEQQLRTAEVLARSEDAKARAMLERAAKAPGPLQLRAARSLAQLDDPSFYDLFARRFQEAGAPLPDRMQAADGLGAYGRRSGAALLAVVLPKDLGNKLRLRLAAAGGILQIAASDPDLLQQESLARIQQRLADPSWSERNVAAAALGDAEPGRALPLLKEALKDEQAEVRQSAARALGRTGMRDAVPALALALDDKAEPVRQESLRSIGQVGEHLRSRGEPVDEVRQIVAARPDPRDVQERLARAQTLLQLGDESERDRLRQWLRDPRSEVRRQAVEACDGIKDLAAQELTPLLPDRAPQVRLAAAAVLARHGHKDGIAVLREALDPQGPGGGTGAITARGALLSLGEAVPGPVTFYPGPLEDRLGQVGAARHLPEAEGLVLLQRAARDAAATVRAHVVEVLGDMRHWARAAVGQHILRSLVGDLDAMVRTRAGLLYGRLRPADAAEPQPQQAPAPDLASTPDLGQPTPDLGAKPAPDLAQVHAQAPHRGQLVVEAEREVRFQVDERPQQTAPVGPLTVEAGKHRVRFTGGSLEIDVPAGETAKVHVPLTRGEQLLGDAMAAFDAGDLDRAQQLLARAKGQLGGAAKEQQLDLLYYQGRVYEGQSQWLEAMQEYERLADRARSQGSQGKRGEQAKEAMSRVAAHLGRIRVSETVDGVCQSKDLWLPPGVHTLDVGGTSREVRVRVGEKIEVKACP